MPNQSSNTPIEFNGILDQQGYIKLPRVFFNLTSNPLQAVALAIIQDAARQHFEKVGPDEYYKHQRWTPFPKTVLLSTLKLKRGAEWRIVSNLRKQSFIDVAMKGNPAKRFIRILPAAYKSKQHARANFGLNGSNGHNKYVKAAERFKQHVKQRTGKMPKWSADAEAIHFVTISNKNEKFRDILKWYMQTATSNEVIKQNKLPSLYSPAQCSRLWNWLVTCYNERTVNVDVSEASKEEANRIAAFGWPTPGESQLPVVVQLSNNFLVALRCGMNKWQNAVADRIEVLSYLRMLEEKSKIYNENDIRLERAESLLAGLDYIASSVLFIEPYEFYWQYFDSVKSWSQWNGKIQPISWNNAFFERKVAGILKEWTDSQLTYEKIQANVEKYANRKTSNIEIE